MNHPVSSGVWQGENSIPVLSGQRKGDNSPRVGVPQGHVCAPWGQDRDRVLFTCSAGTASSAPGAVSDAMLYPLPTPCPWISPQSLLSMPISRQHFPPELLGVQHLG